MDSKSLRQQWIFAMRPAKFAMLTSVLATTLAGCGVLNTHIRNQAELDGYYRGSASDKGHLNPVELHTLVMSVTLNRQTQETLVNGQRVRGVYVLPQGACAIVAVENLNDARMAKQSDVLGVHVQHYRVCGDNASRIEGNDLPAVYPDTGNARATLDQARRAALLYGAQTISLNGYRIDTRQIGVGSAKACRLVETTISHNSLLVLHDVIDVCQ